jgi:hypothetical protein
MTGVSEQRRGITDRTSGFVPLPPRWYGRLREAGTRLGVGSANTASRSRR